MLFLWALCSYLIYINLTWSISGQNLSCIFFTQKTMLLFTKANLTLPWGTIRSQLCFALCLHILYNLNMSEHVEHVRQSQQIYQAQSYMLQDVGCISAPLLVNAGKHALPATQKSWQVSLWLNGKLCIFYTTFTGDVEEESYKKGNKLHLTW